LLASDGVPSARPVSETPEGQRQFPDEVHWMVLDTPNGRGVGIFGGTGRDVPVAEPWVL
jgi:hypothetical protein